MGRKVVTAKDPIGKKIVALGLYDSLLAATVYRKVIIELEES